MPEATSIHVLPGDSLLGPFEQTGIEGSAFVCRECLVDGDVSGESLEQFWENRRKYLSEAYPDASCDYSKHVADQFRGLMNNADGNEINLWFEYELFCQVNLWFTISLLQNRGVRMNVVYPRIRDSADIWKGFAALDANGLQRSFEERIPLSDGDVATADGLWQSFKERDWDKLAELGQIKSAAFPTLGKVVDAARAIGSRPQASLRSIAADVGGDFARVFQEFSRREAVYGFGDLQVRRLFDEMVGDA